jgi:hypothetical protein
MLFDREEAIEYVEIGALNGLFVLGRSIGFIGQYQKILAGLSGKFSVKFSINCA